MLSNLKLTEKDRAVLCRVLEQVEENKDEKISFQVSRYRDCLKNCLKSNQYPLDLSGFGYHYFWNSLELIKKCLEEGLEINVKDNRGYTPLFYAIEKGHSLSMIKMFVEHGADILDTISLFNKLNVKTAPKNALQFAERFKRFEIAEYLRPLTEKALLEKNLKPASNRSFSKRL